VAELFAKKIFFQRKEISPVCAKGRKRSRYAKVDVLPASGAVPHSPLAEAR
jgi:hypothetical protein